MPNPIYSDDTGEERSSRTCPRNWKCKPSNEERCSTSEG
jgi:hypothetical protein